MQFDVPTFHLSDGLYFQRQPDGSGVVRIIKTESGRKDSPVIFDVTIDASQWASVIASMSFYGEENSGFYRALLFHRGDPPPAGVEFPVSLGITIGSLTRG
jgi:hypothetical protein